MPARKEQLRVVGIDSELNFAGGESQVLGLTLELIRIGHRAELICDPAGLLFKRANAAGVRCHPLKVRNALDLAAGMRLRSYLSREHYDVVHFHTSRTHALAPFAARRAAALVVTRRMDYPVNRLFAPWLYHRAVDGIAAISEGVARALESSGVERRRITLIPSGVDCERFRPPTDSERNAARQSLGLAPADFAIGSVGMLEPRKGHSYLLEAAAALASERDSRAGGIRLLIAGNGSETSALKTAIREGALESVATMLGMVEAPLSVLWALDVFVLPSLMEGLGVSLMEAMACGIAPVASRVGGIPELVEHSRSGLLVEPGSSVELTGALRLLANDASLRNQLGHAARERMAQRFSMNAMARGTLTLYRACLERAARNGNKNRCAA